ncbi:hypothetical protein LINGRAHAP2_LOCUS33503 [Linum grandiflorum]
MVAGMICLPSSSLVGSIVGCLMEDFDGEVGIVLAPLISLSTIISPLSFSSSSVASMLWFQQDLCMCNEFLHFSASHVQHRMLLARSETLTFLLVKCADIYNVTNH